MDTNDTLVFPMDTTVFHTIQNGKGEDVFLNTRYPMKAREELERQGIRVLSAHPLVQDEKLHICHKCIDDDEMWQFVRAFMEHTLNDHCGCGHHPTEPREFFDMWKAMRGDDGRRGLSITHAQPPPSRFGAN